MPTVTVQYQPVDLEVLARALFGNLTPAEAKLLRAAPIGAFAICGPNMDAADPANDPSKADTWGSDREIRAGLICWLCLDRIAREGVNLKGIQLYGAKIIGTLDLSYSTVPFPLTAWHCRLVDEAYMRAFEISQIDLQGTWTQSIWADEATVKGSVFLQKGFHATGEVWFPRAEIGGDFACIDATFQSAPQSRVGSGIATLYADRIRVNGSVFLRNSLVQGEVRFLSAWIGSNLECDNAKLKNPAPSGVPGTGKALHADGIKVGGSVLLRNGFSAEGEVNLLGAEIGSILQCDKATFKNPPREGVPASGIALNADHIRVRGYVFLRNGFTAEGQVNLLNAEIGSNLECDNGTFKNPQRTGVAGSGKALFADRIKVGGYVHLRDGFTAEGEVNLLNAEIGSDLNCNKGAFRNPPQTDTKETSIALLADGARVQGGVFLCDGFCAEGDVQLVGAKIGGPLVCSNANFDGGLVAQSTTAGALFWTKIAKPELARLDLVNTSVGALVDDRASWPAHKKLRIDGFVYERLSGSNTPKLPEDRLDWLARQRDFAPQPYRQLAEIFRDEGNDAGARELLYEMESQRRMQQDRPSYVLLRRSRSRVEGSHRRLRGMYRLVWRSYWGARTMLRRFWSRTLEGIIGYGYYPARALWWLAGLTVLGLALLWAGYSAGSIAPSDKEAYSIFQNGRHLPPHYERFHASIYALENSFPLVKLGQDERWQPDPNPQWQCKTTGRLAQMLCMVLSPTFLRWFRWAQICLGWFFTTMGVAGVTGIIHKD